MMNPESSKFADYVTTVNGKATVHTMCALDVAVLADKVESDLAARGIGKADRIGCTLEYTSPGPGATYHRKARHVIASHVRLVRIAAGWRVAEFSRCDIFPTSPARSVLHLTDSARAAAIAHATRETL